MIKLKKIIITCGISILPFVPMGLSIAHASEISGSLSSTPPATTTSSGSLSGSVGGNSTSTGNLSGSVGGNSTTTGSIGGSVGGSFNGGNLGGEVGPGGTLSGNVSGGSNGGGGGGGGGGGNGPISTNTPGNGGGGIVLGDSDNNPNTPGGGLVLGVSTSTTPEFPTTGFGPENVPLNIMLLILLVAAPIVSLSAHIQRKRKKFMQTRRINELNVIDESIFSQ